MQQAEARLERITDLLVDGTIDRSTYQARKESIDRELLAIRDELATHDQQGHGKDQAERFLAQASRLARFKEICSEEVANDLIKNAVSNISVSQKDIEIQWSESFKMLLDLGGLSSSALERNAERIWRQVVTDCDVCAEAFTKD